MSLDYFLVNSNIGILSLNASPKTIGNVLKNSRLQKAYLCRTKS